MSFGTLEGFYEWATKLGHYQATEAVERYRTMVLTEMKKDVKNGTKTNDRSSSNVNGNGTG